MLLMTNTLVETPRTLLTFFEQLMGVLQALVGHFQLGELLMRGEELVHGGTKALLVVRESTRQLGVIGPQRVELSLESFVVALKYTITFPGVLQLFNKLCD